jgi:nicotinamide mononucleotide transporter
MKDFFAGWTRFEKIWLTVFNILIMASTIFFSWTGTDYSSIHSIILNWVLSPLSAITGIVCVVLVAKGKISNFTWGTVNALTYGYVAYFAGYYGDAILNIFYFLPFQLIGFLYWKNNLKPKSKEDVKMLKMSPKTILVTVIGGSIATAVVGYLLFQVNSWFINAMKRNVSIYNYIDSVTGVKFLGSLGDASTEILQIVGQILMTLCYAEQWIAWILTNVITIAMWGTVLIADHSSVSWVMPVLIMWIAYLVNSFYGLYVWAKEASNV